LNIVPAADPFARLRIVEHGILAVDFMFDIEIAGIGSLPMTLERCAHGSVIHLDLLPMPGDCLMVMSLTKSSAAIPQVSGRYA
jgi:hypothetical protein